MGTLVPRTCTGTSTGTSITLAKFYQLYHLIATGNYHPAADKFTLKRFETGELIDETGAGPRPGRH